MGLKLPVFTVGLRFTRPVAGGNPVSTNLIADYIAALESGQSNPVKAAIATDGVATEESIIKFLEGCTGLHYRDNDGPYICDYMIAANLRAAAIALNIRGAKTGALYNVLTQGLMMPPRVHLNNDQESEFITRAIQPFDKGYRNPTLARFEVIPAGAEITFPLVVADDKELNRERLKELFSWGGTIGLGSKRKLGYGKYELIRLSNGKQIGMDSIATITEGNSEKELIEVI